MKQSKSVHRPEPVLHAQIPAFIVTVLKVLLVARPLVLLLGVVYITNPYETSEHPDLDRITHAWLYAILALSYIMPFVIKKLTGYGSTTNALHVLAFICGPVNWLISALIPLAGLLNPMSSLIGIVGLVAVLLDTVRSIKRLSSKDIERSKPSRLAWLYVAIPIALVLAMAAAASLATTIPARMSDGTERYSGLERRAAQEAIAGRSIFVSQPLKWRVDDVQPADAVDGAGPCDNVTHSPRILERYYRVTLSRISLFGLRSGSPVVTYCGIDA